MTCEFTRSSSEQFCDWLEVGADRLPNDLHLLRLNIRSNSAKVMNISFSDMLSMSRDNTMAIFQDDYFSRKKLEKERSRRTRLASKIRGEYQNGRVPARLTTGQPSDTTLLHREEHQVMKSDLHPPWKLRRVINGLVGPVRAFAVEHGNQWFCSGGENSSINFWDLKSGACKATLMGHTSTVRALGLSLRHPCLFSGGDDKMIKCWDLETNKSVSEFYGHSSEVHTMALHPTLDVLVSGGTDGTVRVWDVRTRRNVHVLTGHTGTISDVKCQDADPQVISSSLDSTIRLWDLVSGKTMSVLTHHTGPVRSLALHPTDFTFVSAGPDTIKQWKCPEGTFIRNLEGHNGIVNTLVLEC